MAWKKIAIKIMLNFHLQHIENVNPLNILIDNAFPNIKEYSHNLDNMINRVILTKK